MSGHHFRQNAMEPIFTRPIICIHWKIVNRAAKRTPGASLFRLVQENAAYSKMASPLNSVAVTATRMDIAKMQARAI